jgi:mono/diheme cytochrome c family protein
MKSTRLLFTGIFIGISFIVTSFSPRTNVQPGNAEMNRQISCQNPDDGNAVLYPLGDSPTDPAAGEKIYKAKCIVCHQADGKGLPGAFPPLSGSDYLLADKVRAVAQVLNGSNKELTVNNMKYNTPMPPQVDTKEDAVAVINYVLNNFGNKGGTVTLEEVKDVVINPRK